MLNITYSGNNSIYNCQKVINYDELREWEIGMMRVIAVVLLCISAIFFCLVITLRGER